MVSRREVQRSEHLCLVGFHFVQPNLHNSYVDSQAGFRPAQQADLVNFLLALDDDPGRF
ncbi:MAG: hypothetical protein MJA27_06125 [Pseudanabaenales cyanobacterium]|nr:hypothetical protein [Pseudanabaenales cyanobacterium]